MPTLQVYLIYQKGFEWQFCSFYIFFIKLIYPFLETLSGIFSCLENVQFDLSGMRPEFFHVQNMFGLHVQILGMKKFWISYLIIFWNNFRTYSNISRQISNISMTFFWHSFFIGLKNAKIMKMQKMNTSNHLLNEKYGYVMLKGPKNFIIYDRSIHIIHISFYTWKYVDKFL